MFIRYALLLFVLLFVCTKPKAQTSSTAVFLGVGEFALYSYETFSRMQVYGTSTSKAPKSTATLGLIAGIEQDLFRDWSVSLQLIGQQGKSSPVVISGQRSTGTGELERYEIRQPRKLWSYGGSVLIHRSLWSRYFNHKLKLASGIHFISYEKEYLSKVVLNEDYSVDRRDFTTERGSRWGVPVQLRFKHSISSAWSLSIMGQTVFLDDWNMYTGLALSVHRLL